MATITYSQATQCIGKRRYEKADAKKVARHTETTYGGGKLDAYRCPHCDWWHVGHPPPRSISTDRVAAEPNEARHDP